MRYDLIVVGDDPAGIETAVQSARRGLYVALVDADRRLDPASIPGVDVIRGAAVFFAPDRLQVERLDDVLVLAADRFVIATDDVSELDLESIGVGLDENGRPWCDAEGTTWVEQIEVVGDFQSVAPLSGSLAKLDDVGIRSTKTSRRADAVVA